MTTTEHPARFSKAVLDTMAPLIRRFGLPVHDPFAGDGVRLGALCDELGLDFTGGDIERWPRRHGHVRKLDATRGASYPSWNHLIVTSPVYPNGMADHFVPREGSKRYTYRTSLGQDLHPNNAGRYSVRGGKKAEAIYWSIQDRAVRHWRGPALVNVSDFVFRGGVYPLVDKWIALLYGYSFGVDVVTVVTPRMKNGANRNLRVANEAVLVAIPRPVPTEEEFSRGLPSGRPSD